MSPNRDRLLRTARRMAPMLADVVFVGGQMVELLITEPAAVRIRPTDDVDVVAHVTTRTAYHDLQMRLVALGFAPDHRLNAPICRMRTSDDLVLDVMPVDERVLGFSNRWYPLALDTATVVALAPDLTIRAISAPAFLATKWEAFRDRGAGDPFHSHDLEDIINVMAGRRHVIEEVAASAEDARLFIASETRAFLANQWANDIVAGSLPDARRFPGFADDVVARLRALAAV